MLQPATAPIAPVRPEDETIPDSIPRHGNPRDGRPKIRHADDPTVMSFYRRPSSFGKGIESTFALDRRADRLVVAGMVRFPNLWDDAAAALGACAALPNSAAEWDELVADPDVKRELHKIRDELLTRMGADTRAALGTELHGYRDRLDRGERLSFLGPQMWAALKAWSLLAGHFTWHGSEQFVVCDRWQTAGTYDALWSPKQTMHPPESWDVPPVEPGERLIVDLKSGRWVLRYGEVGRVIQLTQYPHGVPYVHVDDEDAASRVIPRHDVTSGGLELDSVEQGDSGRREWPDGIAPRTDVALIPHVPLESPEDAGLLWVNLVAGAQLSDVAVQVHEARKLVGELLLPAELPELAADARERIEAQFRTDGVAEPRSDGTTEARSDAPTAAEVEMLDHDSAVIEWEQPCPRRARGETCADCDGAEAALSAPEPFPVVAPLLAAREAMFDQLAASRERDARLRASAKLLASIRSAVDTDTLLALHELHVGRTWDAAVHSPAAELRYAELTAEQVTA